MLQIWGECFHNVWARENLGARWQRNHRYKAADITTTQQRI